MDWLWFLAERAHIEGSEIRVDRRGRTLSLPLPKDPDPLTAGPPLPASLRRQVEAMLRGAAAFEGGFQPAEVDVLEKRIQESSGPAAALWFELELARALPRRKAESAALEYLDRARQAAVATKDSRADLLVLGLRAVALLEAGKHEEAASSCSAILKRVERMGDAPLTAAAAHHTLGLALKREGRLEEAALELEKAVSIRHEVVPGSLVEAASLDRLGGVLTDLGRMDKARKAVEQGLKIRQKQAPASLELAESYNTLGNIALMTGRTDEADQAYRDSLRIREGLPGRPGAYKSLHNLALIQYQRRHLKQAMRLLARSRRLLAKEKGSESQMVMLLNTEMAIAMEQGDFRAAEHFGEQALETDSRLQPDSPRAAMILTNLGGIAAIQGDVSRARTRQLRALEILRRSAPDGPDISVVLANLADLDLTEGKYAEALERFRGLLLLLEKRSASEAHRAQVHQNMAFAALNLGRTDEAEHECRTALALRHRAAPGSRGEGVSLTLLGRIERAREHLAEAASLLAKAVRILRRCAPGTVYLGEALHAQGELEAAEGNRQAAIDSYSGAVDALEKQMERLGTTETVRTQFRERYLGWYRELQDLLVEEGETSRAFDVMERSRARSLLALISGRELDVGEDVPPALERERWELAREWDALLSELAVAETGERSRLESKLEALRARQDVLRERIRRAAPRFASLYYPAPITREDAARLAGPGSAVLAYTVGPDHTLLFTLSADGTVAVRTIPAGRQELAQAVELFRGLILKDARDSARRDALRAASRALGKLLIAPAEPLLPDVTTVLILPDGPLNLLPFSALSLSSGGGGTFLCERFNLAVEPSLSVLQELRQAGQAGAMSRKLVALARPAASARDASTPALRQATTPDLPPIPGTLEEVRSIARIWGPDSLVLTEEKAAEGRLVSAAPSASLLHITAHVMLDTVHPLDSAIALEPDPGPDGENGLLQGWEIMESLRLPGGLVTLSGCDTGLGRELDGEGLIGLTRAFEYSGARAVLSSLWRIDDQSTVFLMDRFYAHLAEGEPAGSAFRLARIDLLHQTQQRPGLLLRFRRLLGLEPARPSWPPADPAVWAAFQLHGDPTLAFPAAP